MNTFIIFIIISQSSNYLILKDNIMTSSGNTRRGTSYILENALGLTSTGLNQTTGYLLFSGFFFPPLPRITCICGDMNNDRTVNFYDLIYLGNYLYFIGSPPHNPQCSDVNGDGLTNDLDFSYLSKFILQNGPPPDCFRDLGNVRPRLDRIQNQRE